MRIKSLQRINFTSHAIGMRGARAGGGEGRGARGAGELSSAMAVTSAAGHLATISFYFTRIAVVTQKCSI